MRAAVAIAALGAAGCWTTPAQTVPPPTVPPPSPPADAAVDEPHAPADAAPIPVVHVDPPTVGPAYGRAMLDRVFHMHAADLTACGLVRTAAEPHNAQVAFTIDVDGHVPRAEVTGAVPRAAAACLEASLVGWTFPPPRGAALHVTYPMTLGPP